MDILKFLKRRSIPDEAPAASSVAFSVPDWYCADSPDDSVHQVVMSFPPESVTETPFGMIILPADKYPILSMNSWCTGFCGINRQNVVMFRAGEFAPAVKAAGVTLAISFCHMPAHSVLLLLVRVESPELTMHVRRRFPRAPELVHPIAEWITGLSAYDRELISGVFGSDSFRLVLADDTGGSNRVYLSDGGIRESPLSRAVCEFRKDLNGDLKEAMQSRWRALLAHDAAIPQRRRSFEQAIGAELLRVLPTHRDPILPWKR